MTAEEAEVFVVAAVTNVLEGGAQPARVLVGLPAYKALLARDGLATRSIKSGAAASVRALVLGFDLPVDCDRDIGDQNAACTYAVMEMGQA